MYWYAEYEEIPHLDDTKIFLIEAETEFEACVVARHFIGPGKCKIVPLTVEHLIGKFNFWNGVSCFHD